jgi:phosphohistidine phosphatase
MRVLVVRHAIAENEDRVRWPDDAQRPLTDKGERRFAKIAAALTDLAPAPDAVITSPFVRARQTAAILTSETGWASASEDAALVAGAHPERIAAMLDGLHVAVGCIVGHEPDLGRFVAWMIGATDGATPLKKGGAALLDGALAAGGARLEWLLTPRALLAD